MVQIMCIVKGIIHSYKQRENYHLILSRDLVVFNSLFRFLLPADFKFWFTLTTLINLYSAQQAAAFRWKKL